MRQMKPDSDAIAIIGQNCGLRLPKAKSPNATSELCNKISVGNKIKKLRNRPRLLKGPQILLSFFLYPKQGGKFLVTVLFMVTVH